MRCGYRLTGLAAPGRCPECGTPFPDRHLVLYGVPRSTAGTSLFRRCAWAVLITASVIFAYVWELVLFSSLIMLLTIGASLAAGLMALLLTSRRERAGYERFVVSPVGIARLPMNDPGDNERFDSVIVPWSGATAVELKRISPVWYRIRAGMTAGGGRMTSVVFDAGVRCPDELAPEVRSTLEACIRQQRDIPTVGPQAQVPS